MKQRTRIQLIAICLLAIASLIAIERAKAAADITLDFTRLPSAQGWAYEAVGNAASEGRVFSVSSGTLLQNSIGLGPAGGGGNRYRLNAVVAQAPFVLSVRARVLQEERFPSSDPNNHFGFAFTVSTGTEIFGMGLGTDTIEDENFRTFAQDNTQFHDYRLEGIPGGGYRFFVDGQLLGTGLPRALSEPNGLILGDTTGGTNARAEVTRFSYSTMFRDVHVVSASASPGSAVTIPVELVSLGDENALGFSLTYDTSILSNPQASLGADATGASLNLNTSQTAQGKLGIAVALPATQKFTVGTRRIVNVIFTIAANAQATTTPIGFGDQPIAREVVSDAASILPASYTPGSVTVSPGYEADVMPRPTGNNDGTVTIADWVQAGRFAAGVDTAAPGNEFQRADCAPKETKGDGKMSIADWVQAGRYAAGLDTVVSAGGPTAPVSLLLATESEPSVIADNESQTAGQQVARTVRVRSANFTPGQQGTLLLEFDAVGNENALGFSLNFDPARLQFVTAAVGSGASGAALNINTNQAATGRLGLAIALPAGQTFAAGTRQLLVVTLAAAANAAGTTAVALGNQPVSREVVDAAAHGLTANWVASVVTAARTVASVLAASFTAESLASEAIVAAFGNRLATVTQAASMLPLPTTLAGTTVKMQDSAGVERVAPLFFVAPTQVNYLVPQGMAAGEAVVTVMSGDGVVSSGKVRIAAVAPGLFAADASGQGLAAATVLRVRADGSQSFEPVGRFDPVQNRFVAVPIDLGAETDRVFLLLFGSGWRYRSSLTAVTIKLGGVMSEVTYAGAQGGLAGLDQLNLRIPRSLAGRGEVEVALSIDGVAANPVRISVK